MKLFADVSFCKVFRNASEDVEFTSKYYTSKELCRRLRGNNIDFKILKVMNIFLGRYYYIYPLCGSIILFSRKGQLSDALSSLN